MKIIDRLKRPLIRNSLYQIANYIIVSALGLLFWVVVARLYDANTVGLAIALISAASIVSLLSRLGLDISIIRFLEEAEDKSKFVNSCFVVSGIIAFLLSIMYMIGIDIWSPKLAFINDSILYPFAFSAFAVFFTISALQASTFLAMRNGKFFLMQSSLGAVLKLLIPFALAPFFTVFGIFGAWGISLGIALIVSGTFMMRKIIPSYRQKLQLDTNLLRKLVPFSSTNYIVSLLGSLPAFLIPLLITQILTPAENAYFYISFSIAGIVFAVPTAFSTSLLAEGAYRVEQFRRNLIIALRNSLALMIPILAVILVFADDILWIVGRDYASNGKGILILISISGVMFSMIVFHSTVLRIRLRLKELLMLNVSNFLGVIVLGYILMQHHGIIGIGYSYVIVMGITATYSAIRIIAALGKSSLEY